MATENQPADETPSLEFLEFLGSWEDSDGQWIDPYQLQDTQYADELDQNPDKENKLGGDQTSNKPDNKKSGMKDMTNEK